MAEQQSRQQEAPEEAGGGISDGVDNSDGVDAEVAGEDPEAARRAELEAVRYRQQRRRKLLHDCERLLLLDFDTLAMPGWPDHHQVSLARRRRDSWLLLLSILAAVVLAGMGNLVPALVGGVAFGALALAGLWGLPAVRQVFMGKPSHMELLLKRRRLLHQARKHVDHLEGPIGLASASRPLVEYNPALRRSRFTGLYNLSEKGQLVDSIRTRAQAQLYLIFALEAEKGYNRLREAYLRTHERMLEEGEAEPLDAAARASDPGLVPMPEAGDDADHDGTAEDPAKEDQRDPTHSSPGTP